MPRASRYAVPVVGIDPARLDRRRVTSGAFDGWATLTGTWRQDRLLVERQEPRERAQRSAPRWSRPPCPPPRGGWPTGGPNENIQVPGDILATLAITSVAMFRPSVHQAVLVVAAEEPAEAETVLRPICGDRLCVVRSRWTARQVEEAGGRLREQMSAWLIYGTGQSVSEDGQAVVTAELTRVLPTLARWADTVAEGLLSLTPWLVPQRTAMTG
jgi:hypothetical protein